MRFPVVLVGFVSVLTAFVAGAAVEVPELPVFDPAADHVTGDWLVTPPAVKAGVYRGSTPGEIVMSNGLIRRTWRIAPNAATVGYDNLMTDVPVIRGVKPEAVVTIDGKRMDVGGLLGQPDYAYLKPAWIDAMTADANAFQCAGVEVGRTRERFAWKRVGVSDALPWPPPGVSLTLTFAPPAGRCPGVTVSVHYEMYDGIPLLSKWITVCNGGDKAVRLNAFISEVLAAVEAESSVDLPPNASHPNMHVESDLGWDEQTPTASRHAVFWVADPQYTTQVNYLLKSPVMLECRLPMGPDVAIEPGGVFESFHTFELIYDSTERERKGLAQRRMYRTIAPWVAESPIMLHIRNADPAAVRLALDQCAEVGAEMAILSFGSGFDMENEAPEYIAEIKGLVDYAHSKGVRLGGYSLLASRKVSEQDDVINPVTGKRGGNCFGDSPCLGSRWGQEYFRKLRSFIEQTGMDLLEHDGSYPGDPCASTTHPGHKGLEDSVWTQYRTIADFYHWCRGRGVFLNVPDWYMLNGSNKTGMGYREVNWSLPRERQIILARQNIFDGTWSKTPSMGWMFVPLVEYHGGGADATLEPLSEHLDAYGAQLALNFGAGVQACYRGPRWYDTDATKAVVQKWTGFFKKYRGILESDIVHVRRPDGRDLDCILHVNAQLRPRGLAMVFNPLDHPVAKTLSLPLYYTGLADVAQIREQEGAASEYPLDRERRVQVPVEVAAGGYTWLVVE